MQQIYGNDKYEENNKFSEFFNKTNSKILVQEVRRKCMKRDKKILFLGGLLYHNSTQVRVIALCLYNNFVHNFIYFPVPH